MIATEAESKSVNWLENTSRSMAASFPSLRAQNGIYVTRRLSRLVLDRLPEDVGQALVGLLPDPVRAEFQDLHLAADRQPDLSIGYPAFVEQASRSIREPMGLPAEPEFFERVADYFLWAFAQELPPELKARIVDHLPVDLRNRMNLKSSHADESKVA